jgi:hypothetical protein
MSRLAAFRPKPSVHQNSSSSATSLTPLPRTQRAARRTFPFDQLYRRGFYRGIFEGELELHQIPPIQLTPQAHWSYLVSVDGQGLQ